MSFRPTRRELMRDGLVAGAGAMAAGTAAGVLPSVASAAAPAQLEARALTDVVQIEQLVVIAYRQVLGSGVLTPDVEGQMRTLLKHELRHVALLQGELSARGEIVPVPPSLSEAQAALTRRHVHWSLEHVRNQHGGLKLLVDVESLTEHAYFRAIERVQDPKLARTCAEILGCEAQHWTVLSGLLNHRDATKAVPYPFVEGAS